MIDPFDFSDANRYERMLFDVFTNQSNISKYSLLWSSDRQKQECFNMAYNQTVWTNREVEKPPKHI